MSHVTHLNEACHIWVVHVHVRVCGGEEGVHALPHSTHTHTHASTHTQVAHVCQRGGWVMWCIVSGKYVFCPIYQCILSLIWMSQWAPGPMHEGGEIENRIYIYVYIYWQIYRSVREISSWYIKGLPAALVTVTLREKKRHMRLLWLFFQMPVGN